MIPRKPLHLSDLGLNPGNIRKFEPDIGGVLPFEGYVDEENGLALRVELNKVDVALVYFLGIAKERERCPAFYPIARRLVEVPMCFLCPTISVSSPDEVEEGTVLIFTTNVRVGGPDQLFPGGGSVRERFSMVRELTQLGSIQPNSPVNPSPQLLKSKDWIVRALIELRAR